MLINRDSPYFLLGAQARVERVAQRVAEEVESEYAEADREAREDRHPGRGFGELHRGAAQHQSPGRGRLLHAQAEEGERGLEQDRLAEAALSYLGLGAAEPTPSWGLMLSGSALSYAEKAPWIAIFPGIAISLGVFGFNLFGDSLRDALDPKLRRKG